MIIENFDTAVGLYVFRFEHLETEMHSHPALEMLFAENGSFTLTTEQGEYVNLKFAVIDYNRKHQITAPGCHLKTVMIEHHRMFVGNLLAKSGLSLINGFHIQKSPFSAPELTETLTESIRQSDRFENIDERVSLAIKHIHEHDPGYNQMMTVLKEVTRLSESRLSHLFRQQTGLSLKKYLVWCRLKSAVSHHLNHRNDLLTALIISGFYDHSHFTRNFRSMLGVSPSWAYNSRTVQVKTISPG